jgi:hypothetical protein
LRRFGKRPAGNFNTFAGNAQVGGSFCDPSAFCASEGAERFTGRDGAKLSNLKEHVGACDCHCDCDEQNAEARGDDEKRHVGVEKVRKCLICREPFPSAWSGERVCRRCKTTSTWRSTGMA